MRIATLILLSAGLMSTAGCAGLSAGPPLETVDDVDPERYVGLWYEIARYPNFFQGDCAGGTTAEYTLMDDGRIEVVNRCNTGTLDGPEQTIRGTARIVDNETNAKLAVSFFGPFEGPYWIIGLDEDYQWAIVGEPSRSNLWILSRTPSLDDETLDMILERLPGLDYDAAQLLWTEQPAAE
jgi:apolipoprotein D and lipocalin family protein